MLLELEPRYGVSFNSNCLMFGWMSEIDFQDGSCGGHLGFLIGKLLFTIDKQVILQLQCIQVSTQTAKWLWSRRQKSIFKMESVVAILDFQSNDSNHFYIYWSECCSIISSNLICGVVCEISKIYFQDGHYGGHLGFLIVTILAIFDLVVILLFLLKSPKGLRENVKKLVFKMAATLNFQSVGFFLYFSSTH